MQNPWGLTPKQIDVMRALCEHGHYKVAADRLGFTTRAVERQVMYVRDVMGGLDRTRALIEFDRWDRA